MAGKALFSIMVLLWMMSVMLLTSFKWQIDRNLLERMYLKMNNFVKVLIMAKITFKILFKNAIAKRR